MNHLEYIADFLCNSLEHYHVSSPLIALEGMGLSIDQAEKLLSAWWKLHPKQRLELGFKGMDKFIEEALK